MTLRIPAKVLIHVWSYDFYDMTLSTGKQQRHMINALFSTGTVTIIKLNVHRIFQLLLLCCSFLED